jgi:hypothetical protein
VQAHEETTATDAAGGGGSLAQTFVVRLWEPPAAVGDSTGGLRGVVQHVRSGRSTTFVDELSLLEFLHAARRGAEPTAGGRP